MGFRRAATRTRTCAVPGRGSAAEIGLPAARAAAQRIAQAGASRDRRSLTFVCECLKQCGEERPVLILDHGCRSTRNLRFPVRMRRHRGRSPREPPSSRVAPRPRGEARPAKALAADRVTLLPSRSNQTRGRLQYTFPAAEIASRRVDTTSLAGEDRGAQSHPDSRSASHCPIRPVDLAERRGRSTRPLPRRLGKVACGGDRPVGLTSADRVCTVGCKVTLFPATVPVRHRTGTKAAKSHGGADTSVCRPGLPFNVRPCHAAAGSCDRTGAPPSPRQCP